MLLPMLFAFQQAGIFLGAEILQNVAWQAIALSRSRPARCTAGGAPRE
jgi:hypothetical protein